MKTLSLIKCLCLIGILVISVKPVFAEQLTTQALLQLSIEELMEIKVVRENIKCCQQTDTSSETRALPRPSQKPNNKKQ